MLEITKKKFIFKIKEIWFTEKPFDINPVRKGWLSNGVKDCHSVLFRGCKNKLDVPGFERKEFTTLVIDLNQDLETIWQNMEKSSCRYAITRAQRDGIDIRINQKHEQLYEINKSFRKSKGLPIGSTGQLDFIKKYGTLFVAVFQGEIIAGCLFLADENNIRWLLGASKRLQGDKEKATLIGNANRLIIWQAIKYAKEKGIKEFDFGGYYTGAGLPAEASAKAGDKEKERINKFKKSFGGKLVTHYIYQKDYSRIFHFLRKIFQK